RSPPIPRSPAMPSETMTCPKVPHVGDGYLHGEDDDAPYSVDGVLYCGRCHYSVNAVTRTCERPASPSPAPTLAAMREEWEMEATSLARIVARLEELGASD